jgi:hypothetical protein
MNMMVNTSELVASEAEIKRNSETALKSAISKLVATWEKKQATRAKQIGGFGLLAISLSACNSSSDDTTATTTTPTTPTTDTTTPAAPTVNNITLAAATTSVFGSAGTNDVISGTATTLTSNHLIVDSDTTDSDSLTVAITSTFSNTPTVVGIEDVNFNFSGTLNGSSTTLGISLDNITASGDTITADVVSADSLVSRVDFFGVKSNSLAASDDFSEVRVNPTTDADIVLTVNNTSTTVQMDATGAGDGAADDFTINGGTLNDVTLTSATATEDLVVSGKDITITQANSILGTISLTAANDISALTATAAKGNVTLNAGNDTTVTDVSASTGTLTVNSAGSITVTNATAAKTIVLDNTGAKADGTEGVVITDANSATSATITSLGAITATANTGLAAATSITATAGANSAITADGVTSADQIINLNANTSAQTTPGSITYTLLASDLQGLNLGGTTPIDVLIDSADINAEPVTNTNAAATLTFSAVGSHDLTGVPSTVTMRTAVDAAGSTFTVAEGATFSIDADGTAQGGGGVTWKHTTDASTSSSNSMTLTAYDGTTGNAEVDVEAAGLAFTDINNLTIALGNLSYTGSADITGADLQTVTITGGGTAGSASAASFFNLQTNTITGVTATTDVADVVVNAADYAGVVTIQLDATANSVETITTGSGADAITVAGVADSGNAFNVSTGAGIDTVTVASGAGAIKLDYNGGSGIDVLELANGADISSATINLTSVEEISAVGGGTTTLAASFISGKSFIVDHTGGNANLVVSMDQVGVDLSNLAVSSAFGASDIVTIDASAVGLAQTIVGSAAGDVITGGGGIDTITTGTGADVVKAGGGNDIIDLGATDDTTRDEIKLESTVGNNGIDKISNFATTDAICLDKSDYALNGTATADTANTAIAAGTYYEGAAGAATAGTAYDVIVLTGASYADVGAAEDAVAARMTSTTDGMVIFHDTGTTQAHMFFDADVAADGGLTATATLITFEGVASATALGTLLSNTNFELIA